MNLLNIPDVNLGIVAVSRDCFPMTLSVSRRESVVKEIKSQGIKIFEAKTCIENENDVLKALDELRNNNVNALIIYLGNFGPEGPETMLAQKFGQPTMFVAAAEESEKDLMNGRGDAYCGLLNASYNLGLRNVMTYIPENPVGIPSEIATLTADFLGIARTLIGLSKLKVFSFGPRPFDFLACNAPIKPLFDLGIEIQENSELDLFAAYNALANDPRIDDVVADMAEELGKGNKHSGVLRKLAQYELTLLDWIEKNKGASEYFVFANKCWPSFQTQFGFVPCFVNSRLAKRGIPVACETDIYGAVSEYIITLVTLMAPTLLDINNSVPYDMYEENKNILGGYKPNDLFMGFHCGNTPSCYIDDAEMKYQLIMKRSLEPDSEPDITRGTLEGKIKAGNITLFRLQSTADCKLKSYIAEGQVMEINPKSFGAIGVFAIKEMGRFYRHVLVEKKYPHHAGIAFKHSGRIFYEIMKQLQIEDIAYNKPQGVLYDTENPFN